MNFVFGTVLLVTAIMLLGIARFAVSRFEESSLVRRFAATEATALMITTLSAFGIGMLANGLASDQSGIGLAEFGAAVGIVLLTSIGVIRVTRRPAQPAPVTARQAAV